MSYGIIGLVGNVVVSGSTSALDLAVIDKVNQLATQVSEVQQKVDNIEKGHIDWIDT